jgi:hypothetical protein
MVSVPQWAGLVGLTDDGKSIAAARKLIAKGEGPKIVKLKRQTRNGPVTVDGVRLGDHETWAQSNPWAEYLASLSAAEREKRKAQAIRIVGDAAYTTHLYDRYCASRWRSQMTFEQWLKRRQRLKDRQDGKDVNVTLKDNYAVLAVVKSSMADIKENTFIGTATVAQPDGSLRSLEVVVFPDSLRGFAEGHYPWDLGSSSMMTNATVAQKVHAVDGETVSVTYKGGEKKITIPSNVPIVALVPADKSDIKPAAIVFVPTEKQADGTLLAAQSCLARMALFLPCRLSS